MCNYNQEEEIEFHLDIQYWLFIGWDNSAYTRTVVIDRILDRTGEAYPLYIHMYQINRRCDSVEYLYYLNVLLLSNRLSNVASVK